MNADEVGAVGDGQGRDRSRSFEPLLDAPTELFPGHSLARHTDQDRTTQDTQLREAAKDLGVFGQLPAESEAGIEDHPLVVNSMPAGDRERLAETVEHRFQRIGSRQAGSLVVHGDHPSVAGSGDIGQGRITGNLEDAPIDRAYRIADAEALPYVFDLLEHEGLCLGGSSAINIAGAVRLAREMGPGHTIVTILADFGTRYESKLFNPAFLREKELPVPRWLDAGP